MLCVGVGSGNRRMLPNRQTWDRLRKGEGRIQVRVMVIVAIACPPAGIKRELGQVGKPFPDQGGVNAGGSAAHQGAKRIEICWICSLGDQVRVQEIVVSDLIIRVVVDVHGHVRIKDLNGLGVECIAAAASDFAVVDSAEFVVLDPKVGLEYFQRRWETEQGRISRTETRSCRPSVNEKSRADGSCSDGQGFP